MSGINGKKKEIIDKIKNWLKNEGYEQSVIQEPYADFQINLKNPNMSIILYRNKADSITFATYTGFTDEDKKTFSFFKVREKKLEILWDLQRSLITINVEFSFSPPQNHHYLG